MENTKRYGMVIDLRKCVGCHACTIACKMENATPASCFNTWVEEWDVGEYPNVSRAKLPKLCNHCTDAPCVPVCPVEATYAVDGGMVVVDKEKCIGCGKCADACPSSAISMVPAEMPAQQLHGEAVTAAMRHLMGSKSRQEGIAAGLPGKLAAAVERSNRLMAEDLIREAGYMLPQSEPAKAFLEQQASARTEAGFPKQAVAELLQSLHFQGK